MHGGAVGTVRRGKASGCQNKGTGSSQAEPHWQSCAEASRLRCGLLTGRILKGAQTERDEEAQEGV